MTGKRKMQTEINAEALGEGRDKHRNKIWD